MRPRLCVIVSLFSLLLGCSRDKLVEGGLYYTRGEKGGYTVLKILKIDDRGVHVRLYSNHFPVPPMRVDESTLYMAGMDRKAEEALGMGHLPISKGSFAGWGTVLIQRSTVQPNELDGYEEWKKANGGYF